MAEAKVNMTLPIVESVTLTLTLEEADYLTRFLGQTQIFTVKDLLPSASEETQKDINDALFDVYHSLYGVLSKEQMTVGS